MSGLLLLWPRPPQVEDAAPPWRAMPAAAAPAVPAALRAVGMGDVTTGVGLGLSGSVLYLYLAGNPIPPQLGVEFFPIFIPPPPPTILADESFVVPAYVQRPLVVPAALRAIQGIGDRPVGVGMSVTGSLLYLYIAEQPPPPHVRHADARHFVPPPAFPFQTDEPPWRRTFPSWWVPAWQQVFDPSVPPHVAPAPPPVSPLVELLGLPLWAIHKWPKPKPPVPYYVQQPPPPVIVWRDEAKRLRLVPVEIAPAPVLAAALDHVLRTPSRRPSAAPQFMVIRRRIVPPVVPIVFRPGPVPVAPPARPALIELPTVVQLPDLPALPRPVPLVALDVVARLERQRRRVQRHLIRRAQVLHEREFRDVHWSIVQWLMDL